ncbi:MAG: universal stress protein [Candidatus Promineifilaceae bacterium]|nr:universal stress protein [Candidatus Promineifilaceae bacterium]
MVEEEQAEQQEGQQEEEQSERQQELQELAIRRILVALDTSTHSMAALQAAANLAATLQAELRGLFVEDVNLLRLAALPFAREVRWTTASRRTLDEEEMERELQLRASQARRALAYAAEQAEAEWSFRVVRGVVSKEVLEAALDADLLSLGRASRTRASRVPLGSTARAAAGKAPGAVLLARMGADLEQPIIVTYDGSPPAERALAAAARMSQANGSNLIVLIMADPDEAPQLAEEAHDYLEPRVPHAEYRNLSSGQELVLAVERETFGLLILGGESPILEGDELQNLLDRLDCPVMLVR